MNQPVMVGQPRRRWIYLGGGLLFILLGLMIFAQPAAARSNQWMRWTGNLDFVNNQVNFELLIEIGHENRNGDLIVDQAKTLDLNCNIVGNVVIQNQEATFDGNDYIVCQMPSLVEEVYNMTRGRFMLPPTCPCQDPWIISEVKITDGLKTEFGSPLFYRRDLQFGASLDSNVQKAELNLLIDGALASSSPFKLSGQLDTVTAELNKVASNTFHPYFEVNGNILNVTPAQINGYLEFTNEATELYVGYSPDYGTYFKGTMRSLHVDPPCIGRG